MNLLLQSTCFITSVLVPSDLLRESEPAVVMISCYFDHKMSKRRTNEPRHEKNLFLPYANNKGADQPAHPRSLISTFVVRCLDSILSLVSISEISSL